MSTTHSIKIAFVVDEGVDAGRLMDDLIQHITGIRGTRDLKATHSREVSQWWGNPVVDPLSRPPLVRQRTVGLEPESEPTDEERCEAAREAFPSPPEEPRTETELHAEGGSPVEATEDEVAADDSTVSTIDDETTSE